MTTKSLTFPRLFPRPKAATGIWSWIGTVDHKRIGTLYGITAFIWFIVGIGALMAYQIMRGLYGLEYRIARENSTAAMAVGINVSVLRFVAFVLSAGFAGAAGALIAHQIKVVSPQNLEFSVMITCLTMTVIGGRTSVVGGIIAAVILIHLPEWFRVLQDYRLISFGAVALLMVVIAGQTSRSVVEPIAREAARQLELLLGDLPAGSP